MGFASRMFSAVMISMVLAGGSTLALAAAEDDATPPSGVEMSDDQGPLGDLSEYGGLAEQALDAVGNGDLDGGRAKLDELRKRWDTAAPALKRKSAQDWKTTNGVLERAIAALHAKTPDKEASMDALNALVSNFNDLQGISD
ncbi:MAG: hypothetical protein GAK43_00889 [Stenotrophomonas maltophilia]|nr:MAG: hypothetical protein GAK43_00889 [Stenotrophomonas maltophilia]